MPLETKPSQRLSTLFLKHPCWKIGPLAAELRYSVPSVRRFLAEIGYLSSFTHNGAWYTLGSIPRFDTDGLWYYSDIGFSCAGSLTNTLVELTTRSVAGLSAEQLGAKLRCRCHSVLVQLCRQGRLSAAEARICSRILCSRPRDCIPPAPGRRGGAVTGRNRGSDFSAVYPQPRVWFRAIGTGDLTPNGSYHPGRADRTALRAARSKKKDPNIAANAWKVLGDSLARLSQETLPSGRGTASGRRSGTGSSGTFVSL